MNNIFFTISYGWITTGLAGASLQAPQNNYKYIQNDYKQTQRDTERLQRDTKQWLLWVWGSCSYVEGWGPFHMSVPRGPLFTNNTLLTQYSLYTVLSVIVCIISGRDWPSVVKEACEVSQPRLLHAVQVYRPLSSFFTRWIVKIWLCWLRITPESNPYCFF